MEQRLIKKRVIKIEKHVLEGKNLLGQILLLKS